MLIESPVSRAMIFVAALALAACGNGTSGAARTDNAAGSAAATAVDGTASRASSKWLEKTAATPDGGYRMGNPDAPVKLVEFASLACPHCRDFYDSAMPQLKGKYIATGKVSYEFRNFVLNPADYAVTMLARCSGPDAFFALADAFFEHQSEWLKPFVELPQDQIQQLQALPPDQQVVAYARAGGLDAFMRARGVPESKFAACLTDDTQRQQLETIRNVAIEKFKLQATPTFVINGEAQDGVFTWDQLEPKLQAALK